MAQGFFSTRGRAAKRSPFVQKVRLAALSLQCSSAPPSVLARRSCARFADAGVPGLLLLLCFASGLELPQMRALSIAVAIALRRHVRSCSPRVLHHTHPVDLACFVQVSMSAIQRGAVVVWHAVLPLENSVVHKIFSRGCAPHPLSLETRFSLYHIKVLHLLANRLFEHIELFPSSVERYVFDLSSQRRRETIHTSLCLVHASSFVDGYMPDSPWVIQ